MTKAFPEATCTSEAGTEEMRWITGMFEWIERIQSYSDGISSISKTRANRWNYLLELKAFVDGGMLDDSFIDSVSSIVTRGCHDDCSNVEITMKDKRKENFQKILNIIQDTIMQITESPITLPTQNPTMPQLSTPSPIQKKTSDPTRSNSNLDLSVLEMNLPAPPPYSSSSNKPTILATIQTSFPTTKPTPKPKKKIPDSQKVISLNDNSSHVMSILFSNRQHGIYFGAILLTILPFLY